ncbi:acetaldehyde dehydrogenase (acetylating) [Clostridiales bacterium COT073_COT-073]|nr:acetaldehyde dehydrogenase (acetylating) [Clostridiales bacterium COT073_COT-073]
MEKFDYDLQSIQEARNLLRKGHKAFKEYATYSKEQVDKIVKNMVDVAMQNAVKLGQMAQEETGFGVATDKAYKNYAASGLLYDEIRDMQTVGIIRKDEKKQIMEVADPVGLVMGIVPSTNPTSTIIFKSIIALKSRNAIIFSPHPAALKCSLEAARLMEQAAVEAGAPEGIISCITMPALETTNEIMTAKEVSLIIATGGPAMVKAAYSAGKPAIGVGAGNSPAYIERSADVKKAVETIMASKTFDNGTICASEQSIICEETNYEEVVREFKNAGAYFMTEEETPKVCALLFRNNMAMNPQFVGKPAKYIAEHAGIKVPENTQVLIGRQYGVGKEYPLSYEKLTTVLGFYVVKDWEEACHLSIDLLQNGIGHTMSIHTNNDDIVNKFSVKPASRILVNTGGTQGGTGISTGLAVSFTLGCGTMGGSSVSENVGPLDLVNMKKVAYGIKDVRTLAQNDARFQALLEDKSCCVNGCQYSGYEWSPEQIQRAFEKSLNQKSVEMKKQENDLTDLEGDKLKNLIFDVIRALA